MTFSDVKHVFQHFFPQKKKTSFVSHLMSIFHVCLFIPSVSILKKNTMGDAHLKSLFLYGYFYHLKSPVAIRPSVVGPENFWGPVALA